MIILQTEHMCAPQVWSYYSGGKTGGKQVIFICDLTRNCLVEDKLHIRNNFMDWTPFMASVFLAQLAIFAGQNFTGLTIEFQFCTNVDFTTEIMRGS